MIHASLVSIAASFLLGATPTFHGLAAGEHANIFGGATSVGNAVIRTADGGWLAVGYTSSGTAGGEDVLVVRTNGDGTERWTKTIGGPGDDDGWAVAPIAGGYLISGYTTSYGADGEDVLLVSIDDAGRVRWTKTVGGPGNQRAWAMTPAADGGFFIAGQTDHGPGGGLDAVVYDIDASGALKWTRAFGGPGTDRLFGVVAARDGGATVAGLSSVAADARNDAYIAHLSATGVLAWERRHGGPADDLAHAIAATPDGGYLLTGYGQSFGAGGNDIYLMKCAADGALLWTRTAGTAGDERGMMSLPVALGFITIGYQQLPGHDWDMWIGDFDLEGRLRSQRSIGSDADDRAVMAALDVNGDLIITGAEGSQLPLVRLRAPAAATRFTPSGRPSSTTP